MSIGSFLKLVEIQTKAASIIPFLLGTSYALYRFETFRLRNFLLMFVSLLCVDMATTAINNYQDYKRANKKHGYGYEKHNVIVRDNLKENAVLTVISILLATAIFFGVLLFLHTNMVVLALGVVSFAIGILYSFGPVPISRTPFGEVFSGGFMGFIIPFIAAYIHVFDQNMVNIALEGGVINIAFNLPEVLYIVLISAPAAVGISNIMLANNICDMEDDIENKRYTLPIFIGKKLALKVFKLTYYVGYLALMLALILKAAPLVSIVTFITFLPVYKHIRVFYQEQSKKDTFVVSIKNFMLMNVVLTVTLAIAAVIY